MNCLWQYFVAFLLLKHTYASGPSVGHHLLKQHSRITSYMKLFDRVTLLWMSYISWMIV